MDCLCGNLLNSPAVKGGLLSVYRMLGAKLGYEVVKSLDKGLGVNSTRCGKGRGTC